MSPEAKTSGMQVGSVKQFAIAAALALILLGVALRGVLKAKNTAPSLPLAIAEIAESGEDDIAELIASLVKPSIDRRVYRAVPPSVSKDPFTVPERMREYIEANSPGSGRAGARGPAAEPVTGAELMLRGILGDSRGRIAFVNDRVVKPADEIEGYEIVRVEPRLIVVRKNDQEVTIKLPEPDLKKGVVQ